MANEKKYQVFISSTFRDLKDERQATVEMILDLGQVPSGMEVFPAADEEQFQYIKKVIDECDYYVLIIGARYGSMDESGISFTEKEYDYAVQQRKTVLVFIHDAPDQIAVINVDTDEKLKERLGKFKEKASRNRLVKYWRTKEGLQHAVAVALVKAMGSAPGIGWIRGDAVASEELLKQMNELRIERDKLDNELKQLRGAGPILPEEIDFFDDVLALRHRIGGPADAPHGIIDLSWKEIFRAVAPALLSDAPKTAIEASLRRHIIENRPEPIGEIFQTDLDTIKVRLAASGLIEFVAVKGLQRVSLTQRAKSLLYEMTHEGK
jgi:hypothetical protein